MNPNPTPNQENNPINEQEQANTINTCTDSNTKIQDPNGFGTKKKVYKYPMIKLYLDQDREKLLKDCATMAGIDQSRIDDHQQDVIWELLAWMQPLFEFRSRVRDIVRQLGFKEVDLR